jgi:cell wall assembly regulator SMI1
MWRDILQKLSEDLTFNPPASAEEIARIAGELGTGLPDELRSILSESNGIEGK